MGQQRELEVMVLSAQDLKNVKLLGGAMDPYCVAWIYPHMKLAGGVNKGGGSNPVWNSIITLAVEESLLEQGTAAVMVEIYNHGKMSNKLIGMATVPLSDANGQSKSGSYQVRTKSGKSKGVINIAVKTGKVLSEEESAKYAAPSVGVPAMRQYSQQQQYYPQQYAQQQYAQQQYAQQQYYPQQQQQAAPRRSGLGGGLGGGAGLGLGAGLFGGLLLGSALDGGGGGGGCGGGGCGGGCGG